MIISKLDWDSKFFELNIGEIDCRNQMAIEISRGDNEHYDLIYVFVQHGQPVPIKDTQLVDSKVIYRKNVTSKSIMPPNIIEYSNDTPNDELYRLALQSGEYSRFKLDEKFPIGSYERLYREWIEKSVSRVIADDVLCYHYDGKIAGMVTLSSKNGIGNIGLIAVDILNRGKGIGSVLLKAVDSYFSNRGITSIEVATQQNNLKACSWYEKNGFEVKSITDVYHWWIH